MPTCSTPAGAFNHEVYEASQRLSLEPFRNAAKAQQMASYMKDRFPFIGIARPELKTIAAPLLKRAKHWDNALLINEVNHYFHLPEREYQYLAIDLIWANHKKLTWEDWQQHLLPLFGAPDDAFAWWDSVDALRKPLSHWLLLHPQYLPVLVASFQSTPSFWKRRVAITVQLQYKNKTDLALLESSILQNRGDGEFFIQKAIGWALREYAKTDTAWVKNFLAAHPFSNLATREASKHMNMGMKKN